MREKSRERKTMYVRDPVHGSIRLSGLQEDLLKTVEVQRLSFVHQLGMTFQCYPGAHGMRLVHALGVSHLAGRIGNRVLEDASGVSASDARHQVDLLQAAGMLHDIGHAPWSHTLEPLYRELTGDDHMDLVSKLIRGEETMRIRGAGSIPEILRQHSLEPSDVADLVRCSFEGPPYLQQIIFGEVDADMLDYLQRDFHFTGVAFGHIEVDRILSTMTVDTSTGGLVFLEKGLDAVRDFLLARLQMYSSVYLHKKTRIVDQMLLRAARRSILELRELDDFQYMTDDQLLSFLLEHSSDEKVRDFAWRIKYRQKLFSVVFGIDASSQSESERRFLESLVSGSRTIAEVPPALEKAIASEAGIDAHEVMVDLPLEAVKHSEERFQRTDIRFMGPSGRVRTLEEVDPPFADYLARAMPHRRIMTISCSPEHKRIVRSACESIFRRAAIPLFESDGSESEED